MKRKRGRPKKSPEEIRRWLLKVYLTQSEAEAVLRKAADSGLSPSRWASFVLAYSCETMAEIRQKRYAFANTNLSEMAKEGIIHVS